MHIHTLTLERFRGAQSLTLTLHDKLNVFVGINGAGKTTVLTAAAILLSWLVNRIKAPGASGRPISKSDISNGKTSANLGITLYDRYHDYSYSWNLTRGNDRVAKKVGSGLKDVSEIAHQIRGNLATTEAEVNLPLFIYYPVYRAVDDISLRIQKKNKFDQLTAYNEALTGSAKFQPFFEWFREREDLENENRIISLDQPYETKINTFPDFQLEAVRNALRQFLPEFGKLTVRREPLRLEVQKNGETLRVNQLSDGEKSLMAMIGDLARRLAIANPGRINPLEGDAVVLIDEIDLHLHPKWQRLIVPGLTYVFPNCQFLLTTHSPHIITHVQPENLFILTMAQGGLELSRPAESYGKTIERVSEDLMGLDTTRPNEVNQAILNIYDRIGQGELLEAKRSIIDWKNRIGEDPDLVKAGVLIKRKELIGR
jgi:predicted ATP-binding protein involved in virulence